MEKAICEQDQLVALTSSHYYKTWHDLETLDILEDKKASKVRYQLNGTAKTIHCACLRAFHQHRETLCTASELDLWLSWLSMPKKPQDGSGWLQH